MRADAGRRASVIFLSVSLFFAGFPADLWAQNGATQSTGSTETIEVDPSAPGHPFPHFWEQMFGSGRAILSLRDDYREDLREVKQATGFQYVRFHGVFDDETGLYDEDAHGNPV